jgi:hypothetical protein
MKTARRRTKSLLFQWMANNHDLRQVRTQLDLRDFPLELLLKET